MNSRIDTPNYDKFLKTINDIGLKYKIDIYESAAFELVWLNIRGNEIDNMYLLGTDDDDVCYFSMPEAAVQQFLILNEDYPDLKVSKTTLQFPRELVRVKCNIKEAFSPSFVYLQMNINALSKHIAPLFENYLAEHTEQVILFLQNHSYYYGDLQKYFKDCGRVIENDAQKELFARYTPPQLGNLIDQVNAIFEPEGIMAFDHETHVIGDILGRLAIDSYDNKYASKIKIILDKYLLAEIIGLINGYLNQTSFDTSNNPNAEIKEDTSAAELIDLVNKYENEICCKLPSNFKKQVSCDLVATYNNFVSEMGPVEVSSAAVIYKLLEGYSPNSVTIVALDDKQGKEEKKSDKKLDNMCRLFINNKAFFNPMLITDMKESLSTLPYEELESYRMQSTTVLCKRSECLSILEAVIKKTVLTEPTFQPLAKEIQQLISDIKEYGIENNEKIKPAFRRTCIKFTDLTSNPDLNTIVDIGSTFNNDVGVDLFAVLTTLKGTIMHEFFPHRRIRQQAIEQKQSETLNRLATMIPSIKRYVPGSI